jgi:selenocysteine-specific elongation factor
MTTDLILGTAGHIDHGKTSLIRALTGVDCDRLPEEKRRGITIDIGFAELDLDEYRLGIVDVPGHERFVRNMLAGATGMDLALLIIAADESIKPQTREHLEILKLLDAIGSTWSNPKRASSSPGPFSNRGRSSESAR